MRLTALLSLLALPLLAACGDKEDPLEEDEEALETEDLGSHSTTSDELTGDIAFTVPEGASSAAIYCGPYGDSKLATAWTITDPDGNTFYTNEFHESYAETPMRVGNHDDYMPVLIPVSPDADLSPGTWNIDVWVASSSSVSVDCSAVYRVAEVSSDAVVDLELVFVGLSDTYGLSAETAEDDETLQGVLDKVDEIWGGIGLELGTVTYKDFAGDADTYSVVDITADDASEFNDLLATASPDRPRSLTVFMVEEINQEGSTVVGKSAGPPGIPTVGGTSKSGMVATVLDMAEEPNYTALIIAHEGAHFLGLFHTSEKDGERHDPLSDTPECTSAAEGPSACSGKGGENVMFWAPLTSSTELSSDQGWVLRRNPAVQ